MATARGARTGDVSGIVVPASDRAMSRLKHATRHRHDAIERTVDVPARLATKAGYAAYLGRLLGFYEPIEARLARVAEPDLAGRRKTAWLRADLAALGWPEAAVAALPRCAALPALRTRARALGALYVLEGATLGGQLLLRHVRATLDLTDGCRFLSAYGPRLGPMWRSLGARIDAVGAASPTASGELTAGADATFAALHDWLGPAR